MSIVHAKMSDGIGMQYLVPTLAQRAVMGSEMFPYLTLVPSIGDEDNNPLPETTWRPFLTIPVERSAS